MRIEHSCRILANTDKKVIDAAQLVGYDDIKFFGSVFKRFMNMTPSEYRRAVADSIKYLGAYYGSPAILDEKIYMYLAEGLHFGEQELDDDEFVETERIPLEKLCTMIMNGEVPDGKTQAAVLRAAVMLGKMPTAD